MRRFVACVLMCALAALSASLNVAWAQMLPPEDEEKPIIRWYYQSFPPLHITDGPYSGQGFADKALAYLHAQLPQYNHLKVFSSLSRVHGELRVRQNACHLGLFRTPEREGYAHFSEPVVEILPNRLVVLKDTLARIEPLLNGVGEVDLAQLFATRGLMYGVETDRVYSPRINAYIDAQTRADGKVELPNPRFAALLLHGRIDYGFAFAFEATYRFNMLDRADAFTTLPIAGEPGLLYNYVGCSKTAFGAKVVADVNRIARDFRRAHRAFYEEWLDDRAVSDFRARLIQHGDAVESADNGQPEQLDQ